MEFLAFDGTVKTFNQWLEKGDNYYHYGYGTALAEVLGRVSTSTCRE